MYMYKRGEERCIKTGKGERREVEKKYFARFLKEVRVGLGSPSSSAIPETNCCAHVRIVSNPPLSCHVYHYQKKIVFKFNAYTFSSQHIRLSQLPNLFVWT